MITGIRAAAVVGAVVALTLGGTAGAQALWSDHVTLTASAHAATVSLTATGWDSLTTTYAADGASVTAPTTITDTGTAPLEVTPTISVPAGSTDLAGAIDVAVWSVASTDDCTADAAVPSGAATGTLASPPAPADVRLDPNGVAVLCTRTTLEAGASASYPGASVTAELTVAGSAGGSWQASVATDATQSVPGGSTP